jgi:7,8-dihydroneopterin aldolase/epimerase/oxygenase
MFTVFVAGLEFYGFHGVTVEERTIGHRFVADLRIEVEGRAHQTDSIEDTVDYASVSFSLTELCGKRQFFTLERMADAIIEELLSRHPTISGVWIRIAKRLPPFNMIAEQVGVEMKRSR